MTWCIVLVKEYFFPFICSHFLAISSFKCTNNAIHLLLMGLPFSKVIDEQNTLRILKYRGQNLACRCLYLWSLWTAFTCCCPLSWLPIWLLRNVVDLCFLHCHIFMQKLLHWNSCKQCFESSMHCFFFFYRLGANATPTLNTTFSLTNVHAKWWIHCLLISSTPLLTHATSIYDWPKWVYGGFGVFRDNCQICMTWAFPIICICTTTFNVSILPLNHCFQWSRNWITLIKPLLWKFAN